MIVIIDYGMGNLHSVLKAFRRIGADAIVSSKGEDIQKAEKLVLPGVGHFKKGMENLEKRGLIEILNKKIIGEKTQILGICLGMQLFTKFSEEGDAGGLGWIDARTIKFNLGDKFRVPHMGWNNIKIEKDNKIFSNLNKEDYFYFVHSFHVNCKNKEDILSITEYGKKFISAIQKENIIGVQFHPEKSHDAGLEILKNFAEET